MHCHSWVSPLWKRRPVQWCCQSWVSPLWDRGHDAGLATCGIWVQCKLSDTTGLARGRVGGQRNVALDITVLHRSGMEECQCQSCWFQNWVPLRLYGRTNIYAGLSMTLQYHLQLFILLFSPVWHHQIHGQTSFSILSLPSRKYFFTKIRFNFL
jgi:hypothetical protein